MVTKPWEHAAGAVRAHFLSPDLAQLCAAAVARLTAAGRAIRVHNGRISEDGCTMHGWVRKQRLCGETANGERLDCDGCSRLTRAASPNQIMEIMDSIETNCCNIYNFRLMRNALITIVQLANVHSLHRFPRTGVTTQYQENTALIDVSYDLTTKLLQRQRRQGRHSTTIELQLQIAVVLRLLQWLRQPCRDGQWVNETCFLEIPGRDYVQSFTFQSLSSSRITRDTKSHLHVECWADSHSPRLDVPRI
ncbi:hypothetical protein J6590_002972 [Homalodisca vitripennis]|nr:hypothetical protein J6590_002972 [Homalodisca vitripennis]